MTLVRALILVLLAAPASAAARDIDALVAELDQLRERHNVAAFAVSVVGRDGSVSAAARGLADRASGRPATPDMLWRIGSITKTFNALAFLILAEEGRLDLDAPVVSLAPRAPIFNPWARTEPVRVVHLLEHSSGLLDLTRQEFDQNRPFASLDAALALVPKAREVQWPPGLHRVYSNANAGLAGYVLEQVTGERWGDLIARRLLDPLAMTSAGTELEGAAAERLVTGYDTDGETVIPYWHMIFPSLGAINATAREMVALPRLMLGRGAIEGRRLLSPASILRMERPESTLAARSGLDYGYGPGLDQWLHEGFRFFGHGGDGDGYLSRFAYSRHANGGYFLVINAFNRGALEAMISRVQDWLIDGLEPLAPPPVAAVPREDLAAMAGSYRSVTRRFPWEPMPSLSDDLIVVELGADGLRTTAGKDRRRLIPVRKGHFRRAGQTVATIALVTHEGALYLQGDFGNYRRAAGSPEVEVPWDGAAADAGCGAGGDR